MISNVIFNMMDKDEKQTYQYNNDSYEQAKDEYHFKHQDPYGYETGNLTVVDMRRIMDAQYNMCQTFEDKMRVKYCG